MYNLTKYLNTIEKLLLNILSKIMLLRKTLLRFESDHSQVDIEVFIWNNSIFGILLKMTKNSVVLCSVENWCEIRS